MTKNIPAILDFLVNGLEHSPDAEARHYLCTEFGVGYRHAVGLVDAGLEALSRGMDEHSEEWLDLQVRHILR